MKPLLAALCSTHIVLLVLLYPHPKVSISGPLPCFLLVVPVPLPLLPAQILPTFPNPGPMPYFS